MHDTYIEHVPCIGRDCTKRDSCVHHRNALFSTEVFTIMHCPGGSWYVPIQPPERATVPPHRRAADNAEEQP